MLSARFMLDRKDTEWKAKALKGIPFSAFDIVGWATGRASGL